MYPLPWTISFKNCLCVIWVEIRWNINTSRHTIKCHYFLNFSCKKYFKKHLQKIIDFKWVLQNRCLFTPSCFSTYRIAYFKALLINNINFIYYRQLKIDRDSLAVSNHFFNTICFLNYRDTYVIAYKYK